MAQKTPQVSSYLEHLPAVFQQDADENGVPFIGRFLLAFEKVLTGLGYVDEPGLEEILDGIVEKLAGIHRYFDPGPSLPDCQRAPAKFLDWLAGWVALSLREDWTEEQKRRFISRIVPLYRQRGTKAGLRTMLSIYTGFSEDSIQIDEFDQPPHYFQVKMALGRRDPQLLWRKQRIARAIIDQEKPAHTYYALQIRVPTMQIGVASTVGKDTLLGTTPRMQIEVASTVGVDTLLR